MGPVAPWNHFSELALLPHVAQLPACAHHPCPNRPLPVLAGRSDTRLRSPDRASVSTQGGLKPSWGQAGRGWKPARWPVGIHPGCCLSPLGPLRLACLHSCRLRLPSLGLTPWATPQAPGWDAGRRAGEPWLGQQPRERAGLSLLRRRLLAHLAAQKEKGGEGWGRGRVQEFRDPPR